MVDANSETRVGAARQPDDGDAEASVAETALNQDQELARDHDGDVQKSRSQAPRRKAARSETGSYAVASAMGQAVSPAAESSENVSQSPAARRTRVTRKSATKGLPTMDAGAKRELARQQRDAAEIFASIPRATARQEREAISGADLAEQEGGSSQRRFFAGLSIGPILAAAVTVFWLLGAAWYIQSTTGVTGLLDLPPQDFGLFVTGLLAPLVLLWFCTAYFRQSAGLAQQIGAIRETAESAADHSRVLALTEQHLRLDSYLKLTDFYLGEMAKHAAVLAAHTLKISATQLDAHWQRYQRGDREIFFRLFFGKHDPKLAEKLAAVIQEHPDASKSAHLLAGYYQVFQSQAEQVDRGNLLLEAYRNGFLGDLAAHINAALYGDSDPFSGE